jgi:hypothetical protein
MALGLVQLAFTLSILSLLAVVMVVIMVLILLVEMAALLAHKSIFWPFL